MLLHMQEVEEELKEYVEIFQLKEGARDSSPFALRNSFGSQDDLLTVGKSAILDNQIITVD